MIAALSSDVPKVELATRPVTDPVQHAMERRTWDEFRSTGLLYLTNKVLHAFGWVIVWAKDDETGAVSAFPARTSYRTHSPESEASGQQRLQAWVRDGFDAVVQETKDE
jgi:hypothetical protein